MKTLVFPSGTEVGLEIARALEHSVHVQLHGASSRDDHGSLAFARHARLPNISEPDFDAAFYRLLAQWRIDLVFATHDSVHAYLAPRIRAWGARLVNGDLETAQVARRKSATYDLFNGAPWTPRCYRDVTEIDGWPVVMKPDQGQGGQGVRLACDRAELEAGLAALDDAVICEYLPGEEATVDCFTDRKGQLLHIGPRTRERVVAGVAMRSRPLARQGEIEAIAVQINARLTLRGPWFFQLKRDAHGHWKLLEFSCRLATGSTLPRAAGVNLPLLTVQDHLQRNLQMLLEPRIRLLERRLEHAAVLDYDFDTCYIDLDDTLVCDGFANPEAMRFAYRLLQLGKKLVLLTRHPGDVEQTLATACIPQSLFNEIVHLRGTEPKSTYIRPPAIFVDNHFPERMEVSHKHGIPVFDVDAMGLLFH